MRNMTIAALVIGLITLGACNADEDVKDDTAVEDTADSGTDTGPDTSDTAETGDTSDTADTADTATDPVDTGDTAADPVDTGTDTGADTAA